MPATTQAIIDLAALRHNLGVVRRLCPQSRILAMIKADAYGHGLLPAAQALGAADAFAVARLDEALKLRAGGVGKRLLLLGSWLDADDITCCAEKQVDLLIHDAETAELFLARESWPGRFNIWLKLDSGMHRLGLAPAEFGPLHRRFAAHSQVDEIVHLTHFSSAEEAYSKAMQAQLDCFAATCNTLGAAPSLANSAAIICRDETRVGWVRPGIMLYGASPLGDERGTDLRPVMTLSARVLAVRSVAAGEAVGYGCTWRAMTPTRIATIGIGYGDGYPRHAPNGTPVWIGGQRAPLAGRVSMDSITVDVTDCGKISTGDPVELWGRHIAANEVAARAGTISYELFTGINARVPRRYIDDGVMS